MKLTGVLLLVLASLANVCGGTNESLITDVAFVAAGDGSEQRYVRMLPAGFKSEQQHDVLIALHGHGSDRWQFVSDPRDECRAARDVAAAHGMIYVAPDYRAKTSWMGPQAEADLVQIIGELKRAHRVARVFLCGGSMGGTASLTFAALHPELVDGVAAMNGTANLVEYAGFAEAIEESFGGSRVAIPDEYRKRSAEFWPERLDMPVGIAAGGKDDVVPPQSVVRLANALKARGGDVLLIHREEVGHSTNYDDARAILEFIIQKARPAATASRDGHEASPGNQSSAGGAATNAKDADAKGSERELIRDPHFRRGLLLLDAKPGQRVVYGELAGSEAGFKPIWELAQWTSKFPLAPAPCQTNGAWCFTNVAKLVLIGKLGSNEADLVLGVNASVEYGTRARLEGEPWVHLLVQQSIAEPPSLAELGTARFHIAARLLHSRAVKTADYSPDRHAAQFQVFFTVQNRNPQSPGFGRLLWFGIPLYDDRHRIPIGHASKDTAGSEMFIFTPAGGTFTSASAHDGGWITVDQDLLPLLREALETAWARGFLTESRDRGDYRITSLNLGWEVPGIFDVEMQVRDLSLKVKFNPSGK